VLTGSYVADEAMAARIRAWEPQLVPGLLQTERYAWAVISAGRARDSEDVQRRVMARMARRTLLSRDDAPRLAAVLGEGAIRRPVGGPAVMTAQLRELLAPRGNVSVRVVPFGVGAFPGLEGAFTLLDFPAETTFPVEVYAESIAGDLYPESEGDIARMVRAFEGIEAVALPEDESAHLIREVMEGMDEHD